MPVRFKNRHVCADLRKDKQRGQFRDTRDCRDTPDLAVILAASEKKFCFDLSNGSIDEIHMGFGMGHLELLFFQDVVSVDSVHNLVFGSLNPAVNERTACFFIEGFIGKQIVHDACGRKAKGVCEDAVDPDTGNGHAVLITVFLSSAHVRKFQAVT